MVWRASTTDDRTVWCSPKTVKFYNCFVYDDAILRRVRRLSLLGTPATPWTRPACLRDRRGCTAARLFREERRRSWLGRQSRFTWNPGCGRTTWTCRPRSCTGQRPQRTSYWTPCRCWACTPWWPSSSLPVDCHPLIRLIGGNKHVPYFVDMNLYPSSTGLMVSLVLAFWFRVSYPVKPNSDPRSPFLRSLT
jgi:hypothetical protein